MRALVLPIHQGLAGSSRLPALAQQGQGLQRAEMAWLVGVGIVAAVAAAVPEYGLRIPGHAILRAVLPMAFGLAVAPRHLAGTVMGSSALASAAMIQLLHPGAIGTGAMTSLVLVGPCLDFALRRVRQGWGLYFGFAVSGLMCNVAALGVRGGARLIGLESIGKRPLAEWFASAAISYPICGLAAGLLSAWICFRLAAPGDAGSKETVV
jgi:hypothetical protein